MICSWKKGNFGKDDHKKCSFQKKHFLKSLTQKSLLSMLVFEVFVLFLSKIKVQKLFDNSLPKHFLHTPVLLSEILEKMNFQEGETIIDATLGLGGHSSALLEKIGPRGRLFGFDWDARNREIAAQNLRHFPNAEIIPAPFSHISAEMKARGITHVDAILFDLGISSAHLDDADRGFSFRFSAPLDLRMNSEAKTTAADLLQEKSADELADIFWKYGEECYSRVIAAEIKKNTPTKTDELFSLLERICRNPKKSAARIFQALRIAVNDELGEIERALPQATHLLAEGGRVGVISFHSLEDRIVKNFFRQLSFTPKGEVRKWQRMDKKPISPKREEVIQNPRARSARLRILQKISS